VHFASTAVEGVLPAPLRLQVINASGVALSWRDFHIANTVFCDPANFDPFLLGSEAAGGASFTTALSTEVTAYRWTLSDARLTDLAGRYYRILLAFSTATANTYLRVVVEAEVGGTQITLYQSKLILMATETLVDVGAVPIPPGGYDLLGTSINVRINVLRAGGGSYNLDFAQLTPGGNGLYRKWVQLGFTTGNGGAIEDDGISGQLYWTGGTTHWPIVRGQASPIYVWPGIINRLRILYRETTGFFTGRQSSVKCFYRPRRLDV